MSTALVHLRRVLVLAAIALCGLTVPAAAVAVAWVWPLQPNPPVVRDFDPPAKRWQPGHRGVDLAAAAGATVLAAGAGEVTYAGLLAGRGVVTVTHGALRTTYEPVEPLVSVGQRVVGGDVLGLLQTRGGHCDPAACLHWGLLHGDEYLNPLSLLRQGPSRLLPVWGVPAPYAAPIPPAPSRGQPAAESLGAGLPGAAVGSRGGGTARDALPLAAGGAGAVALAGGGTWLARRAT